MSKNKVLFILKRKEDYGMDVKDYDGKGMATGLLNSATFVKDMLVDAGVDSKLVVVTDNNDIDREVSAYRPTHVIIEALWVVPDKFDILQKLHPNVKWIIRLHSEMPFIANEGIAMKWIGEYTKYENVSVSCNAPRFQKEVEFFLEYTLGYDKTAIKQKVIYLPNYYPQQYQHKKLDKTKDKIDIACFGAIRPLKNQLMQAMAALKFGQAIGKPIRFHVNAGRIEMKGQPVWHNIEALFAHAAHKGDEVVIHSWAPHDEFKKICATMDIALQVSFSETFNIVGADLVSEGVPLIGSREIPWSACLYDADPTEMDTIVNKMLLTYRWPSLNVGLNQRTLTNYTDRTKSIWLTVFLD